MKVIVDFCGEHWPVADGQTITIGREGDIVVDDNPYLHRRFLEVSLVGQLVMISNVGSVLTATVSDSSNSVHAWLASGAQLPLVFERTHVRFTAGSTTYEVDVLIEDGPFTQLDARVSSENFALTATLGQLTFTADQMLVIVALAEPLLRQQCRGTAAMPTTAQAAARLGWSTRRFNKKLDNVCAKLERAGVRGLHGAPGELATSRRARLVEYAVSTGIVSPSSVALLEHAAEMAATDE